MCFMVRIGSFNPIMCFIFCVYRFLVLTMWLVMIMLRSVFVLV